MTACFQALSDSCGRLHRTSLGHGSNDHINCIKGGLFVQNPEEKPETPNLN